MGKLKDRYIRFDWAIKRMLRDKANFAVLGRAAHRALRGQDAKSWKYWKVRETNWPKPDKFNRVDIKAKNSKGEIILVEVQNTREVYYLERILYGVAKTITGTFHWARAMETSRRCTPSASSISIWARGNDYLYHGQEPFHRRAHFRRTANLDQAGGCHPAQIPEGDFSRNITSSA